MVGAVDPNATMSRRVWTSSLVAIVAAAAVVAISAAIYAGTPRLRTQHARPAIHLPAGAIVVTAQGKVFHRPGCPYIHGPAHPISAEDAVREGYTPCTRCIGYSR
jgi:hypothetical protein